MTDVNPTNQVTRRDFVKAGAVFAGTTLISGGLASRAYAAGSDTLKVGLIGCGGRGTGAVINVLQAAEGVELIAVADVFQDRVDTIRKNLSEHKDPKVTGGIKLTDELCFVGFDAYKKLVAVDDVDYVLIATPAVFHCIFSEAAVDAGKHVFCEKPCGVDVFGVRQMMRCYEKAKAQNLGFQSGTQRRSSVAYQDIIQRVHDGAIGKIMYGEATWAAGRYSRMKRQPGWTDMEHQIRDYTNFRWTGGDLPGNFVIHNLDVINWAIGENPVSAFGVGGVHPNDIVGNIYNHFQVELTYPGGARATVISRMHGGDSRVTEVVYGTKGHARPQHDVTVDGGEYYYSKPSGVHAYVREHKLLIESIRAGKPMNMAKQLAEATLSTMMVREAAYTGKVVTWDFLMNESQRRWQPETPADQLTLGENPVGPCVFPGEYELI